MLDKSFVTAWVVAFVRLFARVCSPVVLTLLRCAVANVLPTTFPLAAPPLCALDLDLCKAHRREGRRRRAADGGADVHRGGKRQRHFLKSLRRPTHTYNPPPHQHKCVSCSGRDFLVGSSRSRSPPPPGFASGCVGAVTPQRRSNACWLLVLDHHLPVQGEPAGKEA